MSMPNETYDHDRVVTALFDTRAAADKAKADLLAAGISDGAVTVTDGRGSGTSAKMTGGSSAVGVADEGFWGSLKNFFAPEEDRHAYAEGLHRGGFLLTAHATEAHYEQVIDILDNEGAVDMNERESQWRSEGWTGRNEGYATALGTSTAAAGVGTSTAADRLAAGSTMSRPIETTDERAGQVSGAASGLGEGTIELAEEQLRVGKRDVNHGRVRLRSYVVEKPVDESISLHSERVDIARRPVDRALGVGENAFQERTISAEEHEEEAVVSKDARVYEEISLGKVASDRTQKIHDTVLRTEVEVDDGRTAGGARTGMAATGLGAGSGTGSASHATNAIVEHMDVMTSDGTHVGTVDHFDTGDRIKLTKSDSLDGRHHYIPRSWVERVDTHVHLSKTANEVRTGWTAA